MKMASPSNQSPKIVSSFDEQVIFATELAKTVKTVVFAAQGYTEPVKGTSKTIHSLGYNQCKTLFIKKT